MKQLQNVNVLKGGWGHGKGGMSFSSMGILSRKFKMRFHISHCGNGKTKTKGVPREGCLPRGFKLEKELLQGFMPKINAPLKIFPIVC
jgi:hypothetical protein